MDKKPRTFFKNILYISAVMLIIILVSSWNYKKIVYFADTLRGLAISTFDLYDRPEQGVRVVDYNKKRFLKKTFADMPSGFFHMGNTLFYRADRSISVSDLARMSIEYTNFYKLYSLKNSLRRKNDISDDTVNKGETVIIDNSLESYVTDLKKNRGRQLKYTRGLYYSGDRAGSLSFINKLKEIRDSGINTIVFDVKDIPGIVHTLSNVETVSKYNLNSKGGINNLPMLLRKCRELGIYTIARIAVFRDHLLYKNNPDLRIKSRKTGQTWNPGSKEMWCDPTNKKVQDYNIALASELANAGVDEIQFDYIRFATVGDLRDANYKFDFGKMNRMDSISHFLERAYKEISSRGAFLSIDIFGVVAWGKSVDISKTGQQIDMLAKHCDVISPMLYPSHFNDNFDGFKNPGDQPFHFIYQGCKKVMEMAKKKIMVRPWLQAFKWRVRNYNAGYIAEQVRASEKSGSFGYLFWNAANRYGEVFQALREVSQK